jgi:hypothetical protein
MARVSIANLVKAVNRDPGSPEWTKQVPAAVSLYITFHDAPAIGVKSSVHGAADGSQIVLDIGTDGKVYGIEIT